MVNKKIMILIMFLVALLAVSTVNAAENATDDVISVENQDDMIISEVDDDSTSNVEDPILNVNPKTFSDLNATINDNNDSDVYLDSDYTYDLDNDTVFKEGILINRAVTIHGNGHAIDGNHAARIFNIQNKDVFLYNLTFVNGKTDNKGGAIYWKGGNGAITNCNFINCSAVGRYSWASAVYLDNSDNCTISNCNFIDCHSVDGGAITWGGKNGKITECNFINCSAGSSSYAGAVFWSSGVNGSISNCTFTNVFGDYGGAIYWHADNGKITDCDFTDCLGKDNGGAIFWSAQGTISGCNFTNCSAWDTGGALYASSGRLSVSNCNFWNCSSKRNGGVLDWRSDYGFLSNCTFINSHSDVTGGAINWAGAYASILNCNFTNCTAKKLAGAIAMFDLEGLVDGCNFNDCSANNGSAIYVYTQPSYNMGTRSISNCNFNSCHAIKYGVVYGSGSNVNLLNCNFNNCLCNVSGAVSGDNSNINISSCNFINNHANSFASAVYWFGGKIFINDCIFDNCSAEGSGGAIVWSSQNGVVSNCSFSNCFANGSGGAICGDNINAFITNCNFNNCSAIEGGAVCNLTAVNCTFNNNRAKNGGAAYLSNAKSCNFTCNNATEYGGAMYGISYADCIFVNNIAGIDGNDFYNQTVTTQIVASPITTVYNVNKYMVVTLKDIKGNNLVGYNVTIKLSNGKTVTQPTDKNGQVKLSTSGLVPNVYTAVITYAGDISHKDATGSAKITVKKANVKLAAKAKAFKLKDRTKKYTLILKNNVNKAIKSAKIAINVNKKTYYAKTNSKGVALFKFTKLTKKGKFKAVIKYAGDKNYNKLIKKVIIVVK